MQVSLAVILWFCDQVDLGIIYWLGIQKITLLQTVASCQVKGRTQ